MEKQYRNDDVIRRRWAAMDERDWDGAARLLTPDYVGAWPQSRERIVGSENFIAINARYPGSWAILVTRLVGNGDQIATEVHLANRGDPGETGVAVSFFTLRDGLIVQETDWWPEPYDAPDWRPRWVKPMD
ncbi:MAG TPA: nuclear transport factor 2 family protein [Thermomicrobiales bacterium]|nr:nuclear transport factor 2 family protein [Thermomicrobiales bacterium]